MLQASCGLLKKFLSTFLLCHYIATERESHSSDNRTQGRPSSKPSSVNGILYACLHGMETAFVHPRPAVTVFLIKKKELQRATLRDLSEKGISKEALLVSLIIKSVRR